ncbi:hypothetical protein K438DRAFT_1962762 [Mycena galopus ATCC 62051]|nr:hypothetical protein K438DRAFT_1962762 [Mycena galopus ATCC 62051]
MSRAIFSLCRPSTGFLKAFTIDADLFRILGLQRRDVTKHLECVLLGATVAHEARVSSNEILEELRPHPHASALQPAGRDPRMSSESCVYGTKVIGGPTLRVFVICGTGAIGGTIWVVDEGKKLTGVSSGDGREAATVAEEFPSELPSLNATSTVGQSSLAHPTVKPRVFDEDRGGRY